MLFSLLYSFGGVVLLRCCVLRSKSLFLSIHEPKAIDGHLSTIVPTFCTTSFDQDILHFSTLILQPGFHNNSLQYYFSLTLSITLFLHAM